MATSAYHIARARGFYEAMDMAYELLKGSMESELFLHMSRSKPGFAVGWKNAVAEMEDLAAEAHVRWDELPR